MSTLSVLVVDDEDGVRSFVEEALAAAGFTVVGAATGAEALERALLGPDLVILDVTLPDLSGFEVCACLKKDPATASLPVLFISGVMMGTAARIQGLETGADAYLTKPFTSQELVATVRALLRARRAEQQAEMGAALLGLAEAIGALSELDAIKDVVVHEAPKLVGVSRCAIFLSNPDPPGRGLALAAASGAAEEQARLAIRALGGPTPVPAVREALERREPVIVTGATVDRQITHEVRERLAVSAMAVLPLVSRGRVLGVMTLDSPGVARGLSATQTAIARGVAAHAALAIDRAHVHLESERRRAEAEALAAIGRLLSGSLDRRAVGQAIVDSVRTLLRVGTAALVEVRPGRRIVDVAYSGDEADRPPVAATEIPDGATVAVRRVVRPGPGSPSSRAALTIALTIEDRTIGVLTVTDAAGRWFTPHEIGTARAFAAHAALALRNARLFEQQQALLEDSRRRREETAAAREQLRTLSRRLVEVQEAERRHLARELHDEVGQTLTALRLALDAADRRPDARVRPGLQRAQRLLDDLSYRIRELSRGLRPEALDHLGLVPALLSHFERYTEQTGVRVEFRHAAVENARFPNDVEIAAYRVVQEALTNVARHAGVPRVTVRAWVDDDLLAVQVEDTGPGLPDGALTSPASSGLAGMRERVTLLRGRLDIETARGGGVRVTAEFPLPRAGREA